MIRTVKAPEERREDILAVAADLFMRNGYEATSVDQIVRSAAIAKGTFYYYFSSKKAALEAIARKVVQRMVQVSQAIEQQAGLGAIEKLCAIFAAQSRVEQQEQALVDDLHRPENRELHDQINMETIKAIGPILANVIQQGCQEGVFDVPDPLSTVQFLLAGSQMIFDRGAFDWTPEELIARHEAMILLIERGLGAAPGSISLIEQALKQEIQRSI
ncbi:MAG: TetR/AcrR family transcriptional regulator [Terracidiphilus sp.]|jgi:AcrR family transcriptional regulator